MNAVSPDHFERLVHKVIDDLIDECSINQEDLINGTKLEARNLVRDTLRFKQELLDKARSLRSQKNGQVSGDLITLNLELRRNSLRILEKMRELGI